MKNLTFAMASVMMLFSIQNAYALGGTATQTTNQASGAWINTGTQTTLTCATTGQPGPCPNQMVGGQYHLGYIENDWSAVGGGTEEPSKQISGSCPDGTHKSTDNCCCIND